MYHDWRQMEWVNPKGFTSIIDPDERRRWGLFWSIAVREVTLDKDAPLTLRVNDGCYVQPDRHFTSDLGSIPPPLTAIPGLERDRFPKSYLLHDSACDNHGLYFSSTLTGPFVFCEMPSESVHKLLRSSVRAEGGNAVNAAAIYAAVRSCGPRW